METNSVFFMGTLNDQEKKDLNNICKKIWNTDAKTVSSHMAPVTLEFFALALKGSSPVFLFSKNLFFNFEEEKNSLSYKKVKESKNNCSVGVVLLKNDKKEDFCLGEENKPDFFISLLEDNKSILFV